MKVSELIKKLTALMNEVGDIGVYIGGYFGDEDREEYNTVQKIDVVGSVFNRYIYLEKGDYIDEP